MIHADQEILWLIIIEFFHPVAALYQVHITVQRDGSSTSGLLRCNVVSSIFSLRLALDQKDVSSRA
jgi:hypothetical protein